MMRRNVAPHQRLFSDQKHYPRRDVTVCIATLFRWNYGTLEKPEVGMGALTASDRMITFGEFEYEPAQQKVAYLTSKILPMIAGEYTVHSEAIKRSFDNLRKHPNSTPFEAALSYGQFIQAIQRRYNEDRYLAPLGMNTDSFIALQREMTPGWVADMTNQLQNPSVTDLEAIIVGFEGDVAHLYHIDHEGIVRTFDDIGFATIGIGSIHAKSRLMQFGYVNLAGYAQSLAAIYTAKKAAETAPGVGKATDMHLILRRGIEKVPMNAASKVEAVYDDYITKSNQLGLDSVKAIQEFIDDPENSRTPDREIDTHSEDDRSGDSESGGNNKATG